jgi:hypothetical protein
MVILGIADHTNSGASIRHGVRLFGTFQLGHFHNSVIRRFLA